jgi:hypothetical protein
MSNKFAALCIVSLRRLAGGTKAQTSAPLKKNRRRAASPDIKPDGARRLDAARAGGANSHARRGGLREISAHQLAGGAKSIGDGLVNL